MCGGKTGGVSGTPWGPNTNGARNPQNFGGWNNGYSGGYGGNSGDNHTGLQNPAVPSPVQNPAQPAAAPVPAAAAPAPVAPPPPQVNPIFWGSLEDQWGRYSTVPHSLDGQSYDAAHTAFLNAGGIGTPGSVMTSPYQHTYDPNYVAPTAAQNPAVPSPYAAPNKYDAQGNKTPEFMQYKWGADQPDGTKTDAWKAFRQGPDWQGWHNQQMALPGWHS